MGALCAKRGGDDPAGPCPRPPRRPLRTRPGEVAGNRGPCLTCSAPARWRRHVVSPTWRGPVNSSTEHRRAARSHAAASEAAGQSASRLPMGRPSDGRQGGPRARSAADHRGQRPPGVSASYAPCPPRAQLHTCSGPPRAAPPGGGCWGGGQGRGVGRGAGWPARAASSQTTRAARTRWRPPGHRSLDCRRPAGSSRRPPEEVVMFFQLVRWAVRP